MVSLSGAPLGTTDGYRSSIALKLYRYSTPRGKIDKLVVPVNRELNVIKN